MDGIDALLTLACRSRFDDTHPAAVIAARWAARTNDVDALCGIAQHARRATRNTALWDHRPPGHATWDADDANRLAGALARNPDIDADEARWVVTHYRVDGNQPATCRTELTVPSDEGDWWWIGSDTVAAAYLDEHPDCAHRAAIAAAFIDCGELSAELRITVATIAAEARTVICADDHVCGLTRTLTGSTDTLLERCPLSVIEWAATADADTWRAGTANDVPIAARGRLAALLATVDADADVIAAAATPDIDIDDGYAFADGHILRDIAAHSNDRSLLDAIAARLSLNPSFDGDPDELVAVAVALHANPAATPTHHAAAAVRLTDTAAAEIFETLDRLDDQIAVASRHVRLLARIDTDPAHIVARLLEHRPLQMTRGIDGVINIAGARWSIVAQLDLATVGCLDHDNVLDVIDTINSRLDDVATWDILCSIGNADTLTIGELVDTARRIDAHT